MYNGMIKQIEVAILVNPCNKYNPGVQEFTIPALMSNTASRTVPNNNSSNILNADKNLGLSNATYSGRLTLTLPKEYTRNYPTKVVPAGTKFLVLFVGDDITNPRIIGRCQ